MGAYSSKAKSPEADLEMHYKSPETTETSNGIHIFEIHGGTVSTIAMIIGAGFAIILIFVVMRYACPCMLDLCKMNKQRRRQRRTLLQTANNQMEMQRFNPVVPLQEIIAAPAIARFPIPSAPAFAPSSLDFMHQQSLSRHNAAVHAKRLALTHLVE
jgi:hypothetical protein